MRKHLLMKIGIIIVMASCSKSNDPAPSISQELSSSAKTILTTEKPVNYMHYLAVTALSGNFSNLDQCAFVEIEEENGNAIYSLRFTTEGCGSVDKVSGRVYVYVNPETLDVLVAPATLSINDVKINGNYVLQQLSGKEMKFMIPDGKLTDPNGKIINFSSTRFYNWIAGDSTPLHPDDDQFEIISGNYFITTQAEGIIKGEVKSSLIYPISCEARKFYPLSGKISVETTTANSEIDFGSGKCEDRITQSPNN